MIQIASSSGAFEREPLATPFGFKGGTLTELWQSIASLKDTAGRRGLGVGTQSVLWSDSSVFHRHSETDGNALMHALTRAALERCPGREFAHPEELTGALLAEIASVGPALDGKARLRATFLLNAMVPVDLAAWQLFADARGTRRFGQLASNHAGALPCRHRELAIVPAVGYSTPLSELTAAAAAGTFLFKIKVGSDPAGDGDREKMLAWDCQRLGEIHAVLRRFATPHTASGRMAYYLDANGRYDSPQRLQRLLDHCDRLGALESIVVFEEPFPEGAAFDVHGLPVRFAADESACSVAAVAERIDRGYRAIALKPAAKTLSICLQMASVAAARQVPCFCADLTANPVLLDWSKVLAAHLPPLPGLELPFLESNGPQFYAAWDRLLTYLPRSSTPWSSPSGGRYRLDDDFFARSGGIFDPSPHYAAVLDRASA